MNERLKKCELYLTVGLPYSGPVDLMADHIRNPDGKTEMQIYHEGHAAGDV